VTAGGRNSSSLAAREGQARRGKLQRAINLRRVIPRLVGIATVAGALAIWSLAAWLQVVSPTFLPSPLAVWQALVAAEINGYRGHTLLVHTGYSLFRVLTGFVAAVVLGVPVGLLMGRHNIVHAAIDPFIEFFRPLPPLGYYMLLVLWLGIGEASKIALLFLSGFPVMVVSAASAVRGIQEDRLRVARSLGLSERQVFWSVILPATLPALFTAARLTVGVTFGSLVAAEIVAATSGLGFLILNSSQYLRTNYVFMGIVVIGLIAVVLDRLTLALEKLFVPWAGKA